MLGYSTFKEWSDSREILELEVERGNYISAELKLATNCLAKWVTYTRKDATIYNRLAGDDSPVKQIELDAIYTINLKGAVKIQEDGDSGYLYIKPNSFPKYGGKK